MSKEATRGDYRNNTPQSRTHAVPAHSPCALPTVFSLHLLDPDRYGAQETPDLLGEESECRPLRRARCGLSLR
jgi:hypothetical protein